MTEKIKYYPALNIVDMKKFKSVIEEEPYAEYLELDVTDLFPIVIVCPV